MDPRDTREDSLLLGPKIKNLNTVGNQKNLNCISLLLDEEKIIVNGAEINVQ